MSEKTLPAPTTDFAQAKRDVREHGYAVLAGLLSADQVARLRERVEVVAAEQRERQEDWTTNGNQKVFMLLNHGQEFLELAEHPVAVEFAADQVGPDPLLSSITANIAKPGNVQQQLHADQQYVPEPWPYVSSMNVVWALDDFTSENGATVVVPGSHLLQRAPDGTHERLESITGPAGSAVVLDGRVWHGAGVNKTESGTRIAILSHYCAPYIRQQENIMRSLRPEVRSSLTAGQRKLLGYDVWSGLGVVGGPPRDWTTRKDRSGPTNADGLFQD
ncbi:phytanoyl-CoA dioxygenase family protein [Saccharothrix australiensis]|uniref:Ectoine hydroxylase-related dioxygenase (Phytanoyl-CoA dioxygenase family) n=1 Tax=Saccharothrix australiensis TaxID=2072 RepID=A0A495W9F9_9PSEU|nr:phytanoyl-CoA dioxygenase family protein [Saccharothrix australiensis]RKT57777.1 ectoine hydroxylase-related dioxygenase (phytanoyl-CoA dioxygenase family) [Saccharothrix australiensis]